MEEEYFIVVDENDKVIGRASRSECHSNPTLIHRVVHVLVFTSAGELILQKRSMSKDIQPGKWDTSVGGHCGEDEDYLAAAYREMEEELGIKGVELTFIGSYIWRSEVETESVHTFACTYDGPISQHPEEIDEVRSWNMEDIKRNLGSGIFTPNFEEEFRRYQHWRKTNRHTSPSHCRTEPL
jgi:isopentenyl-diphosphate delta-isomerase type 1